MNDQEIPLTTLFTVPKPFQGSIDRIQRNAISSWKALGATVRVVLMGNEVGTAEIADELDVPHVADIETNRRGTPNLSNAFSKASQLATTPLLAYVNADIILLPNFVTAIEHLHNQVPGNVLMIGRRTELDLEEAMSFDDESHYAALSQQVDQRGRLGPVVCKDYFVFRKGQYTDLPSFSVGRGNWDNWMVSSTNRAGVPVVDATRVVTAIHQDHGYDHVRGGRRAAYVTGFEARANLQLAGGRNLVTGCEASHTMSSGPPHALHPAKARPFWSDLRAFAGLLANLAFGR